MNAEVYLSNIYWNKGLASYFFREQSMKTFEELVNSCSLSGDGILNLLDERTEGMGVDKVEEMFYEDSVKEIAEYFGISEYFENED